MKISHIAAVLMLGFAPLGALAQTSSMTDQQVMEFVVKEHKLGTSQSQIATKLIQRGVDIQQIRRVRKMYDRQIQNQGLGTVVDEAQRATTTSVPSNSPQPSASARNLHSVTATTKTTQTSCSSKTSWAISYQMTP